MGAVDRSDEMTVRPIRRHTSGLADYPEDRLRGGRSLIARPMVCGGIGAVRIEDSIRNERKDLKPRFPPQDPDLSRSTEGCSEIPRLIPGRASGGSVTSRPFIRPASEKAARPRACSTAMREAGPRSTPAPTPMRFCKVYSGEAFGRRARARSGPPADIRFHVACGDKTPWLPGKEARPVLACRA